MQLKNGKMYKTSKSGETLLNVKICIKTKI